MDALYRLLLSIAIELSGIPVPENLPLPAILFVTPAQLQEIVCGGRDCAVRAIYRQATVTAAADEGAIESDVLLQSIMIHEFVHYLQAQHTDGVVPGNCWKRYQMEMVAYRVQQKFLETKGIGYRPPYDVLVGGCDW